jgi:hypothetical protein
MYVYMGMSRMLLDKLSCLFVCVYIYLCIWNMDQNAFGQVVTYVVLCTCIHTYIRTYIQSCIHTYIHTYIQTCIHTQGVAFLLARANIHIHMHIHTHAHIHAYIHVYIHAQGAAFSPAERTNIYIHIHINTHTYIHTGVWRHHD